MYKKPKEGSKKEAHKLFKIHHEWFPPQSYKDSRPFPLKIATFKKPRKWPLPELGGGLSFS